MKKLIIILSIVIAGVISVNAQQAASTSVPKAMPVMKIDLQPAASNAANASAPACTAGNGKACCQKGGASCQGGHGGEGRIVVQGGKRKSTK